MAGAPQEVQLHDIRSNNDVVYDGAAMEVDNQDPPAPFDPLDPFRLPPQGSLEPEVASPEVGDQAVPNPTLQAPPAPQSQPDVQMEDVRDPVPRRQLPPLSTPRVRDRLLPGVDDLFDTPAANEYFRGCFPSVNEFAGGPSRWDMDYAQGVGERLAEVSSRFGVTSEWFGVSLKKISRAHDNLIFLVNI